MLEDLSHFLHAGVFAITVCVRRLQFRSQPHKDKCAWLMSPFNASVDMKCLLLQCYIRS